MQQHHSKESLKERVVSGDLSLKKPLQAAYSSEELLQITNALKLAAKLFEPLSRSNLSTQHKVNLPLMESAVDVAFRLMAAGAPLKHVIAGLLHDSFNGYVNGSRDELAKNIDRKFGQTSEDGIISPLLSRVSTPDRADAEVWLARKKEIVQTILDTVPAESLRSTPFKPEDLEFVLSALRASHNLFSQATARSGGPSEQLSTLRHTFPADSLRSSPLKIRPPEVGELVLSAPPAGFIPASFNLFDQAKPRPWGPNEQLSMFRHSAEVGLLLFGSGQPKEVVAAGLMHDFYEGYVSTPREQIEAHVIMHFGEEVHHLISAVTEPPKAATPGNWRERKLAVVQKLQGEDATANTIVCASKISTIAEGNKFLYEAGVIDEWSSGSWADNLAVFKELRDLFTRKGVPADLIKRYDLEITRWSSWEKSTIH